MHHEKRLFFFIRLNVEKQSIAGPLHAGPFWVHLSNFPSTATCPSASQEKSERLLHHRHMSKCLTRKMVQMQSRNFDTATQFNVTCPTAPPEKWNGKRVAVTFQTENCQHPLSVSWHSWHVGPKDDLGPKAFAKMHRQEVQTNVACRSSLPRVSCLC